MKQIPSLPLTRVEQDALRAALQQAGVAPWSVCVSRHDLPARVSGEAWVTVSGPGWCRTYRSGPDWTADLTRDLRAGQAGDLSAAGAVPGATA